MLNSDKSFFKQQFRHLNYYSLPMSMLFILRKSLNFMMLTLTVLMTSMYTVL